MTCFILLQDGGKIILESGNGFLLLSDCQEDDNGWLGGTFNDPYAYADKARRAAEIREAQEEIIRLKQEQQEIRLQEIQTQEAKDKQTRHQLNALAREKARLQTLVVEEMAKLQALKNNIEQRNAEALLVLSIAYPFLTIQGGETMH